jgi:hypothetical protein
LHVGGNTSTDRSSDELAANAEHGVLTTIVARSHVLAKQQQAPPARVNG